MTQPTVQPETPDWETAFRSVTDRDGALELWQRALASGVPTEELRRLGLIAEDALDSSGGVPGPSGMSPEELRELARTAKDALRPSPSAPPEPDWEELFAAVRDRDEAVALWRRARAEGVAQERLAVLVDIAKAPLVDDREKARAVYDVLAAHTREGRIAVELLRRLIAVMKERVPA